MGLKTHTFFSTFLVLSVVHYGSAMKSLPVFMGDEIKAVQNAYEAIPWGGSEDDGTGVKEDQLNALMRPQLEGLHWTIADGEEKDSFTKLTEGINWRTIHRLLKDAKTCVEILKTFKLKASKSKWNLEDERGEHKKIIIFAGFGKNGYTASEIGIGLYKDGFNVIIVGYPSRDGTRTKSKEWIYLRKKLMKQQLDSIKTPTGNSFEYIEVYKGIIEENKFDSLGIPNGKYLYIDGQIGVREHDTPETIKFPLATINFLKSTITHDPTIISIGGTVHLDAKYGIYRYVGQNLLPSILPHGSILINFIYPYVLTPKLQIEWDDQTRKMVSKSIIDIDTSQMENVTFAVAFDEDLYEFMDNNKESGVIETAWNKLIATEVARRSGKKLTALTTVEKACPQHLLNGKPNYSEVLNIVVKTAGISDFYYLEENLCRVYNASPSPVLIGPLE